VRRRALIGLLAALPLALPMAARAQGQSARAFVEGLYEPYKKAGFKGQPYWETDRFFVQDLADAIRRDLAQSKRRNEPPLLNGDPFVDAQDWSSLRFGYAVATMGDGYATASVVFNNQGTAKQLALFLLETPRGWRIDDIAGRRSSLRALYNLR
jgi:hypothetical protein